jgi:hypothetical protein
MSVLGSKMHSGQPPSNLRPTLVQPRPAYLVRLTLDGLDAWTSNSVRPGVGDPFRGSWGGSLGGPLQGLGVALIAGAAVRGAVAQLSGLSTSGTNVDLR